jgi:hypothetical protein
MGTLLNSGMILQKFERGVNTYRDQFIPGISNAHWTKPTAFCSIAAILFLKHLYWNHSFQQLLSPII